MSYTYFAIGNEDAVLGFRCAGIPGRAVTTAGEMRDALKFAREQKAGIVIVTEAAADLAAAEIETLRFEEELPMVVQIPGAQGPLPGRRTLSAMIREAIGIKV